MEANVMRRNRRRRHVDEAPVYQPYRLGSGKWIRCMHWVPPRQVGPDPHDHDKENA
jgi:hypothetical protein